MSTLYPDQLKHDVYYTANELRGWVRREWLVDYPSWVVAVLENGKMVCVANVDIEHAEENT